MNIKKNLIKDALRLLNLSLKRKYKYLNQMKSDLKKRVMNGRMKVS